MSPSAMNPAHRTWHGGDSDDIELLATLPEAYRALIAHPAGFILYHGAIYFRGCVQQPDWHSLWEAWHGERSFHRLYPNVFETDIPFAQDQVGDQYLLRGDEVFHLDAETGGIERFASDLYSFLAGIDRDIVGYLNVGLDHPLHPGYLLHAYPPFCMTESGEGTSSRPVPSAELILFHADLASRIREVQDGGEIVIAVTD